MIKEIIDAGYDDLSKSIDISKNTELVNAVNNTLKELNEGKIELLKKLILSGLLMIG